MAGSFSRSRKWCSLETPGSKERPRAKTDDHRCEQWLGGHRKTELQKTQDLNGELVVQWTVAFPVPPVKEEIADMIETLLQERTQERGAEQIFKFFRAADQGANRSSCADHTTGSHSRANHEAEC